MITLAFETSDALVAAYGTVAQAFQVVSLGLLV